MKLSKMKLYCNAPQGVEKGTVVGMACRGPHVKGLEHFFVDKRYKNALLNLIYFLWTNKTVNTPK